MSLVIKKISHRKLVLASNVS